MANPHTVPMALMHNLKHNCVLHEQNLILSVVFHERAYVEDDEHVRVTRLADGFWRVCINYGFMPSWMLQPSTATPGLSKTMGACGTPA